MRTIVTGHQMVMTFWIARLAMENWEIFEFIKKELDMKGDEASEIYQAICDFLDNPQGKPEPTKSNVISINGGRL